MVGPTWIAVAQHVPFVVGAARLVSLLAFTDLHQTAACAVRVHAGV